MNLGAFCAIFALSFYSQLYCARLGFEDLDSARQSKIEAKRSERRSPAPSGQGNESERCCNSKETPYITSNLRGGLGNKLFQIATCCAVAWDYGAEAYFPALFHDLALYAHFFLRCKAEPPSQEISLVRGESFPIVFENKMQLEGYFQEERLFAHHREKLLKLFAPVHTDLNYIKKKYGWIVDRPDTVGVQLRFYRKLVSDGHPEVVGGFPQYGKKYLEQAMSLFPKNSLFVISSDDLNFARQSLPDWATNVYFIQNEPDHIDIRLLSLCKHNIISNSSFGWWAAWLNQHREKIVVCPAYWTGYASEYIYPKDWIRINAEAEDL